MPPKPVLVNELITTITTQGLLVLAMFIFNVSPQTVGIGKPLAALGTGMKVLIVSPHILSPHIVNRGAGACPCAPRS